MQTWAGTNIRDDTFAWVEIHELSQLRVAYADAKCYIDTEKHLPAALELYDIWHEVYADRNKYKLWNGEIYVTEFFSEVERI